MNEFGIDQAGRKPSKFALYEIFFLVEGPEQTEYIAEY